MESKKEIIEAGEATEQEIAKIKALLGNPHDVIKAVQKLVEENNMFKVTHIKLTTEKESGKWEEWEKKK